MDKRLLEYLEEKLSVKSLLIAIFTLLLGGGTGITIHFSALNDTISDKIGELAKPTIDKTVKCAIDSTLEVMAEKRKTRLAERFHRDSLIDVISAWYLQESEVIYIGLFLEEGRLKYRDTDGEEYIPAYNDTLGMYYFYSPVTRKTHWCQ